MGICSSALSIIHAESPKRDEISQSCLYVILYHISLFGIGRQMCAGKRYIISCVDDVKLKWRLYARFGGFRDCIIKD